MMRNIFFDKSIIMNLLEDYPDILDEVSLMKILGDNKTILEEIEDSVVMGNEIEIYNSVEIFIIVPDHIIEAHKYFNKPIIEKFKLRPDKSGLIYEYRV